MEGFLTTLMFVVLGFICFCCFCIYFIFKIFQFVIQAINLYKDMVIRQDAMLKLLKDIRDISSGKEVEPIEDVKVTTTSQVNSQSSLSTEEITDPVILEKVKALENGNCPECGVKTNKKLRRCMECSADFSQYKAS